MQQCVSIDSFALKSDTFAFIKKQIGNQEAPFVLHYHQEPVYDRLPPSGIESSASSSTVEMDQLITLPGHEASKPCPRHWATSKKEGRPHKSDTWELDLKKGERVEIFRDMGNDWYVGMGPEGILGMCHHSWLTFDTEGSRDTYTLFHEHCLKILVPGKLRDFPPVKYYANTCKKGECQLLKKNQSLLGICEHDLRDLLQASGSFDRSWVKAGRNNWHPDKFARFCVPDRVEDLKPKAQEMFVLYGILIETM